MGKLARLQKKQRCGRLRHIWENTQKIHLNFRYIDDKINIVND